ncbi:MAG: hydrogenase maturation nickel metallochaperone HypA [Firmicutes bacterium]|nr:hydrogenase maturation nickel metallochaperone HypA [Bacillota bacterium]
MHEIGLIQEVIGLVRASALENGLNRVTRIKLVVGKMTAAKPESLEFAFGALSMSEPWLQGAVLEIEERELVVVCSGCGERQEVHAHRFRCRSCGGQDLIIAEGRELRVESFEGEADGSEL